MLQQTTVATVIPFWHKWMERFPTVESLATADEQEVLGHWQGLGYYSRARNLQKGARQVVEEGLPTSAEGWKQIPGIGDYTSGAIASIAQGLPVPLVDGNVERVYSRLMADFSVGQTLKKNAWDWAKQTLAKDRPGDWNQALMELGATVCTPQSPQCHACPVQWACRARERGQIDQLPQKAPKREWKHLSHQAWLIVSDGKLLIEQVPKGEWWEGLWQVPRAINSESGTEELSARTHAVRAEELLTINHVVTHHKISLTLYRAIPSEKTPIHSAKTWEEVLAMPLSAPQRKILTRHRSSLFGID
jgi:A/G-specific adenine glycosylase